MKINSLVLLIVCFPVFVGAGPALAGEEASAFAILGSTPFAQQNYGINVVRGYAKLATTAQGTTQVVVTIHGLKPGRVHSGDIHGGTCAQIMSGSFLYDLKPIVIDSAGKGSSKTDIPAVLTGFKDCEWWLAIHEGPENSVPTPGIAVGAVLTRTEMH